MGFGQPLNPLSFRSPRRLIQVIIGSKQAILVSVLGGGEHGSKQAIFVCVGGANVTGELYPLYFLDILQVEAGSTLIRDARNSVAGTLSFCDAQ